mmetsp:Transcript_5407/g.15997  ORF Transcript_5407/g.15997 Transcript_5407/m.15997 type:complete len:227 (+) Transcript_5407:97-777(+)
MCGSGISAAFAVLFCLVLRGTNAACLCIFDTDRTLTGRQGDTENCPLNKVEWRANDTAYGGGPLTLSALSQSISKTFCSACYLGVISAGIVGGADSAERRILHSSLSSSPYMKWLTKRWQSPGCTPVTGPLITGCIDGHKQTAVPGIIDFYTRFTGDVINDWDVHFFDDRKQNIVPFWRTPYNAHQISCSRRDRGGDIGLCGASADEVGSARGVTLCAEAEHGHLV